MKSILGQYTTEYVNNENGDPLTAMNYENGELYMQENYAYDAQGRVVEIYRENYAGDWTLLIKNYYDGAMERPYYRQWGDEEYYEYEYEYDDERRLISETEKVYASDGKLFSVTTKTYEY